MILIPLFSEEIKYLNLISCWVIYLYNKDKTTLCRPWGVTLPYKYHLVVTIYYIYLFIIVYGKLKDTEKNNLMQTKTYLISTWSFWYETLAEYLVNNPK